MPSVHENEVNDQAALIIQLYTLQWALYYENLVLIQANLLCLKIRCECNCGSDHNLPKVPKQNQNRKWLSISSVCSLLENQVHIGERDLHVFVLLCFLCMFQHNTQHGREGIPRFSITGNGAEKRGKEGRCSLSTGNYWQMQWKAVGGYCFGNERDQSSPRALDVIPNAKFEVFTIPVQLDGWIFNYHI